MDFLKIRKKARERSAGRGRARSAATAAPTATPTSASTRPATATLDPAAADAAALEGELAARLAGPPALDEGFTTWRPGSEPAPQLVEPHPPPRAPPVPREEDFAVVARAPAPAAVPAEAAAPASATEAAPPAPAPLDEFFYRADEELPELPGVGGAVEPARGEDPDALVREEYLTFLLGREEYAVAIERVREVVKAPPVTEVPRAPGHIVGVASVRGEVVAVLDPRRRLGLPGAPPTGGGRIVIVDAGEGVCGLLVDAVASVVRLRPGAIEPCPQGVAGARAEYLAGIGREGDRIFTVLDLGALLRRAAPARRPEEEARRAGP